MINFKKTAFSFVINKNFAKRAMTFLTMILLAFTVNAQNRTVTGKVTNEKGEGLGSATVEQSATNKTKTASDGTFSLSVPENAKSLTVSYVGYEKQKISILAKENLSISLLSKKTESEEIIVTGYTREKKSQFVGAATNLSGKVVDGVPVGAFDQALQGRAAGLLVNSGSGQPGSSANVTIRGVQSIAGAGAQPLYVLDGVPIAANDMQTINANDFESITILKDASAAALYGARAGTGVIVLTSKKGKAGKTQFTYRMQYGFTQAPNPNNFDMMNTSEILAYEERAGLAGVGITGPGWAYSKKNPSYLTATPAVQAQRDFLLDSFSKINTDFYKLLFRQGISRTNDINMSGGTDKMKYYASLGYFNQDGTDLTSGLKRYTGRFNLEQNVGRLTVQFNNSLGFSLTNLSEGDFRGNSARNPFQIVWRAKPYENPLDAIGNPVIGASTNASPKLIGNAIEGQRNSFWQERQFKINSGITLALKITDNFTLKNTTGVDIASETQLRAINANSYVGSLQTNNAGYFAENARTRANLINTSNLTFNKTFAKVHEIEVGGYFEVVKNYNRVFGYQLFNLDPRLTLTGQGAGPLPTGGATTYTQNGSGAKSEAGIQSLFSTAKYSYKGKYTATASVRQDVTSRILLDDNKKINTWSYGLAWDVAKENFFEKQNIFQDFKLRFSYGQTPNIGSIATQSFVPVGGLYAATNYLGPQLPSFSTTTGFAGSPITGVIPNPANTNLKIEYIKKSNFGVDFTAWNRRVRTTVDIYTNRTVDLFVNQPLPSTSGFGGSVLSIDAGVMSNKGIEATIAVDVYKTKNLVITLGANHAINRNKIEDLGSVEDYQVGTSIIRKGLPLGTHYTIEYVGADVATGKPTWRKADGTTTLVRSEAAILANFGTWQPKNVGGFNLDIVYKKFSFSALFSYQTDVQRYNNVESWTTRGDNVYANAINQNKRLITEQWQKPGDVKYFSSPAFDRDFSSADIMDAKFLRFRNLNVSYAIPELKIGKTSLIKSGKFYIQAQNLAIWSPWRGLDPEDSNNISLNEFPNPRMFVFGLDINF